MTRARDVADTQDNLGGAVAPFVAGKNKIINGDFGIWQRGTSISQAGNLLAYSADRWQALTGTSAAATISRQATGDTTNLPNIQYCARFQRNAGQTGTGDAGLFQSLETSTSIPLSGKSVTLSFYARAGANYSPASNYLISSIYCGSGTDQNIFSYTGFTVVNTQNNVLTTTWKQFSISAVIPANATEVGIGLFTKPVGTAGAADYFETTGVQLEIGSVATPFTPAGGGFPGAELALCQRYYYRVTSSGLEIPLTQLGNAYSTTVLGSNIPFPVTMRTAPSAVESSLLAVNDFNGVYSNLTNLTLYRTTPYSVIVNATSGALMTANRSYWISTQNATGGGYIGLTAEL